MVPRRRGTSRKESDQRWPEEPGQADADRAPYCRKHQAFDGQLPHQADAGRTQRSTDLQFARAAEGTRHEQRRNVGTRNRHYAGDDPEQNPQCLRRRAGQVFLQTIDVDTGFGVLVRIRLAESYRNSVHFRLCPRHRDPVAHPSDDSQVARIADRSNIRNRRRELRHIVAGLRPREHILGKRVCDADDTYDRQ